MTRAINSNQGHDDSILSKAYKNDGIGSGDIRKLEKHGKIVNKINNGKDKYHVFYLPEYGDIQIPTKIVSL